MMMCSIIFNFNCKFLIFIIIDFWLGTVSVVLNDIMWQTQRVMMLIVHEISSEPKILMRWYWSLPFLSAYVFFFVSYNIIYSCICLHQLARVWITILSSTLMSMPIHDSDFFFFKWSIYLCSEKIYKNKKAWSNHAYYLLLSFSTSGQTLNYVSLAMCMCVCVFFV